MTAEITLNDGTVVAYERYANGKGVKLTFKRWTGNTYDVFHVQIDDKELERFLRGMAFVTNNIVINIKRNTDE